MIKFFATYIKELMTFKKSLTKLVVLSNAETLKRIGLTN